MKRAILASHTGDRWYGKGLGRLAESYEKHRIDIGADIIFFPADKNIHRITPYKFKPQAFFWAISLGYESILWMDCANWFNKSPEQIFSIIEIDGYYLQRNGWTTGEWCADSALAPLGITREESFSIPHLMANAIGLSTHNETAMEFLKKWMSVSDKAFPGAWDNKDRQCSKDDRVLGHRHDQTAASVISYKMDMRWHDPQGFISYEKDESAIIFTEGM